MSVPSSLEVIDSNKIVTATPATFVAGIDGLYTITGDVAMLQSHFALAATTVNLVLDQITVSP
jgi:hypothetical protein